MNSENKKQDPLLYFFFTGLVCLIIALLGCLLWLKHISALQVKSNIRHYKSYLIANQLRSSSDDLSKMVRLYVVTGEKKYLNYFNEILSIRSGKTPRPKEYDNIYWDLVTAEKRPSPYGEKKSLFSMMLEYNFSIKELNLLEQAEQLSNKLADLEKKVIHAISKTSNKELAMNLVFGKKYMETKAQIMKPIRKFITSVAQRTSKQNQKLAQETSKVISIAIILSILSTLVLMISIAKALITHLTHLNFNCSLFVILA